MARRTYEETNNCSLLEFYADELPVTEHDYPPPIPRPFPTHSPVIFGLYTNKIKSLASNKEGFMILYQPHLAGALPVPVFLSSLLQLPFIRRILGPHDRIGIITANALHLTPRHLQLAGMEDVEDAKIIGIEERPAFREAIFGGSGSLDYRAVQEEVVIAARELVQGKGRVKAILLECSNLPPYAAAVQKAVGLPVFDFNTMIHQVYRAIRQSPYHRSPCNSRK